MAAGDPSASEVFADFLGRSNVDFEDLCNQNPGQEEELRRLHGELDGLLQVRGQADLSGSVTEEIERRHGADIDPAVTRVDPEPLFGIPGESDAEPGGIFNAETRENNKLL